MKDGISHFIHYTTLKSRFMVFVKRQNLVKRRETFRLLRNRLHETIFLIPSINQKDIGVCAERIYILEKIHSQFRCISVSLSFSLYIYWLYKSPRFNLLYAAVKPATSAVLPMSRETSEMSLVFRGFRGLLVFRLFSEFYFYAIFFFKNFWTKLRFWRWKSDIS